jgi:hypothetical protein
MATEAAVSLQLGPGSSHPSCRGRSWERCRLGFGVLPRKHMRFPSTKPVGAWRNGGARALGARGCGFESHRPDHPQAQSCRWLSRSRITRFVSLRDFRCRRDRSGRLRNAGKVRSRPLGCRQRSPRRSPARPMRAACGRGPATSLPIPASHQGRPTGGGHAWHSSGRCSRGSRRDARGSSGFARCRRTWGRPCGRRAPIGHHQRIARISRAPSGNRRRGYGSLVRGHGGRHASLLGRQRVRRAG